MKVCDLDLYDYLRPEDLYEFKQRMFRYGMLYGERIGFNTAIQFFELVLEEPATLKEVIKYLKALQKTADEEYAVYKEEAKALIIKYFGEEVEDAEEQRQGEEI